MPPGRLGRRARWWRPNAVGIFTDDEVLAAAFGGVIESKRGEEKGRSRFQIATVNPPRSSTHAMDAIVGLGFERHEARAAVDAAIAQVGEVSLSLEAFLRVALSKSPRPR